MVTISQSIACGRLEERASARKLRLGAELSRTSYKRLSTTRDIDFCEMVTLRSSVEERGPTLILYIELARLMKYKLRGQKMPERDRIKLQ